MIVSIAGEEEQRSRLSAGKNRIIFLMRHIRHAAIERESEAEMP